MKIRFEPNDQLGPRGIWKMEGERASACESRLQNALNNGRMAASIPRSLIIRPIFAAIEIANTGSISNRSYLQGSSGVVLERRFDCAVSLLVRW
jgi:hypothetical protein